MRHPIAYVSSGRLPVLQRLFMILVLGMALLLAAVGPARAAPDSKGTEFWLMFNENLTIPTVTLFITGDIATTGTVSIPGLSFTRTFSVTPGTVTSVVLPSGTPASGADNIENKGVRVIADAEVTVYGLNQRANTTDAFLGLPVDILGTQYINLTYRNVNVVNGTQMGIVATQNETQVTITPTALAGLGRVAGVPYSIILNQGQTYQLRSSGASPADLSGTLVSATKPIAVFGSHQCANIPAGALACDHLVEQLPSTDTWGKSFVTLPLATRLNGDTWRILAGTNNTQVFIGGALVATLQRGQLHERIITTATTITATEPVLVAQYSNSTTFDGITSDPFMMLIPPFEQFLAGYTVTTPASGFGINYINVVVPTSSIGSIRLDGAAVPAASFTAIPGSSFSGAKLLVSLGSHTVAGSDPFGIFVYGFANADSYGYPGGQSLSPVATAQFLDLTPKTSMRPVNTQHCVDAKLSTSGNVGVPGVRVDFSVTGANPRTSFVNTAANGIAQYCFVGTNPGLDTIVGSVGTLNSSGTNLWTPAFARCDVDRNGSIDRNDAALVRAGIGQTPTVGDPRDANGDGLITMTDVRQCTLQCTKPNCAP